MWVSDVGFGILGVLGFAFGAALSTTFKSEPQEKLQAQSGKSQATKAESETRPQVKIFIESCPDQEHGGARQFCRGRPSDGPPLADKQTQAFTAMGLRLRGPQLIG